MKTPKSISLKSAIFQHFCLFSIWKVLTNPCRGHLNNRKKPWFQGFFDLTNYKNKCDIYSNSSSRASLAVLYTKHLRGLWLISYKALFKASSEIVTKSSRCFFGLSIFPFRRRRSNPDQSNQHGPSYRWFLKLALAFFQAGSDQKSVQVTRRLSGPSRFPFSILVLSRL